MKLDKYKQFVSSVAAGALLVVGLLLLLNATSQAAPAAPVDLFVAPGGSGAVCSQLSPCPLQIALGLAINGDTILRGGGCVHGHRGGR